VEEDGGPERDEAEEGGGGGEDNDGEAKGDVLLGDADGLAGFVEEKGEEVEVVFEEDGVGGVDGGGAADAAHGNAYGGAGERGGVVDAVAHHGEAMLGGESGDTGKFVFGAEVCKDVGEAECFADGVRVGGMIAGEHDGGEFEVGEFLHEGGEVFADLVGKAKEIEVGTDAEGGEDVVGG